MLREVTSGRPHNLTASPDPREAPPAPPRTPRLTPKHGLCSLSPGFPPGPCNFCFVLMTTSEESLSLPVYKCTPPPWFQPRRPTASPTQSGLRPLRCPRVLETPGHGQRSALRSAQTRAAEPSPASPSCLPCASRTFLRMFSHLPSAQRLPTCKRPPHPGPPPGSALQPGAAVPLGLGYDGGGQGT